MIYRFGAFTLDTDRYELRRDGGPVAAEPKVLEVLAYLVAERHRVVPKEELVERVWGGQFVSDSAVSRAIRETRRALGETAAESRWVKTVYGRGFAFSGPAAEVDSSGQQGEPSDTAASPRTGAGRGRNERFPLPAPLTSLIGRDRELEEVSELLRGGRLLTLTGAGGAGKTRLALEVAHRIAPRFRGGAAFVALAEISEPDFVAASVARALGTGDAAGDSPPEAILQHIAQRELLLILDNFEHLIAARHLLPELLAFCPNLVILVTSRFVLQVEGEQEYPVPPLDLPASGAAEDSLEEAPSVALFLERARAVQRHFDPQGEDLAYVAEICRRLDGLPLAIELAAARVKVLTPSDLWQRLAARSDLLSALGEARPLRHRSLELALNWSYELLDEAERILLQRLSVFAGGCTLSAAEQVCGSEQESVLDTLTALLDKSLVSRLPSAAGEVRFGLLETTRKFAGEQLAEADKLAVREAHARWFLDLVREGEQHLVGGDQLVWLERLDAEYGNLLAALRWARVQGDPAVGLATAAGLARYWSARGIYREGRQELESLLERAEPGRVDPSVRADALIALGLLCLLMCDYPAATESLEKARGVLGSLDDKHRLAETLNHLAWVVAQGYELDQAESLAHEALALHREHCDDRGISVAFNNLGYVSMYRGDADRAEKYLAESLAQRRKAGDERGVAFALANLAILRLLLTDRWQELGDWLDEARSLIEGLGDPPLKAWVLCGQAVLAARSGDADQALAILGEGTVVGLETAHPDGRAWSLLFLGETHRDRGDSDEARRQFETVHQIWTEIGAPWGVAQAAWRLAEIATEEGDPQKAQNLLEESIALFERLGARVNVEACQRALGELGLE